MLTLYLGNYPLVLPTKEIEDAIARLIDTKLYPQPSSPHQNWNPTWHERKLKTVGLSPPNWPKPPELKLNQLYWPTTGASRFAYGHFLITKSDYDALLAAEDQFIFYAHDGTNSITVPMFPLEPRVLIKESTVGQPLYVLPLVDERFFWQFQVKKFNRESATWKQVWDEVSPLIQTWRSVAIDSAAQAIFATGTDEQHFWPDKNLMVNAWNPIGLVIDAMMTATGFRFIYSPGSARISAPPSAYSSDSSDAYRIGGGTTNPRIPHKLTYRYWDGTEPINRTVTSTKNKSGTAGFDSLPEWNIGIDMSLNQPDTQYAVIEGYLDNLSSRYFAWASFQYDITYSGIRQTLPHFSGTVNGTIDSFVFSLGSVSEFSHSSNQLTSRVMSLPPWAIARQIAVAGLERDDDHFIFTLTESLETGSAAATLTYMDGTRQFNAIIHDPLGIFEILDAGDQGYAVIQNDIFYVTQSKCPEDEFPSSSSVYSPEPEPEPL